MRRFLFVIHYPVFGGPHNQALSLAGPLRTRGWETLVLLPDEPGNAAERLRAGGVETLTLPLGRLRASRSLRPHVRLARSFRSDVDRIESLIRSRDIELVVVGGLHNPHGAFAARRTGSAIVWQLIDASSPMSLRRLAMPLVVRLADVVMTCGNVAAVHPGAMGLGERLVPFPPPVDVHQFVRDPERRAAAREELGLQGEDLVIGNVSNFSREKDHLTFVRAAAVVHRDRPSVRFVILGAQYPHRTSYVENLLREAKSRGLPADSLTLRDPGGRVAELAPAFDVFWLTSTSESGPAVVGEAMALGLPVVATDVGIVRTALAGGAGSVVPTRDPAALALATMPYLDDEGVRESAGRAGRLRAPELFSVERCADAHVLAFERALEHAATRR